VSDVSTFVRTIHLLIQDLLAMKLPDGELAPGDTLRVDTDAKKGEITFRQGVAKAPRK